MQERIAMRQIGDRIKAPAHTYRLYSFSGVGKYKSVWRAIRKGLVGRSGEVLPMRPFNNSKRTPGRMLQKDFEKASVTLKSYLDRARKLDAENAKES